MAALGSMAVPMSDIWGHEIDNGLAASEALLLLRKCKFFVESLAHLERIARGDSLLPGELRERVANTVDGALSDVSGDLSPLIDELSEALDDWERDRPRW